MEIREGNIGRIFIIRFDDKEDFIEGIVKVAKDKKIKSGIALYLGALRKADVVVGPKEIEVPPDPVWYSFTDGREIIGIGTIFEFEGEPKIHLHSSMGRGEKAIMGCIRKNSEVFLTVETVIIEFINIDVIRKFDNDAGIVRLCFGKE